jgi:hypothetical protein
MRDGSDELPDFRLKHCWQATLASSDARVTAENVN